MRKRNDIKKTVMITGASAGIGADFAEIFAQNGFNLVLTARHSQRLGALATKLRQKYNCEIICIISDLEKSHAVSHMIRKLFQLKLEPDILINNAGFGIFGEFAGMDLKNIVGQIQVNIRSLTEFTHALLPKMLERGSGKILNVSSTAAFQAGPFMAVYYATKAYVESLTEALAEECHGTGIQVSALCPGPTATQFQSRAYKKGLRIVKNNIMKNMSSRSVAEAGYRGLMRGKRIIIPGFKNKLGVFAGRFFPRKWIAKTVRKLHSILPE